MPAFVTFNKKNYNTCAVYAYILHALHISSIQPSSIYRPAIDLYCRRESFCRKIKPSLTIIAFSFRYFPFIRRFSRSFEISILHLSPSYTYLALSTQTSFVQPTLFHYFSSQKPLFHITRIDSFVSTRKYLSATRHQTINSLA